MHILTALRTVAILAAPDIPATQPPGGDKIALVAQWIKWGGGLGCVVGLIVVGVMMAIQHRRGTSGEHGAALFSVAIGSVVVGSAAALVTALGA
jgi:hypothetical protein